MPITDRFTLKFLNTEAGLLCTSRVRTTIVEHGVETVAAHIDNVVENTYASLPSGDYGRGDVRRVVENAIEEARKANPAA